MPSNSFPTTFSRLAIPPPFGSSEALRLAIESIGKEAVRRHDMLLAQARDARRQRRRKHLLRCIGIGLLGGCAVVLLTRWLPSTHDADNSPTPTAFAAHDYREPPGMALVSERATSSAVANRPPDASAAGSTAGKPAGRLVKVRNLPRKARVTTRAATSRPTAPAAAIKEDIVSPSRRYAVKIASVRSAFSPIDTVE